MLPLLRPNPAHGSLPSMPFSAGTQAYDRYIPSFMSINGYKRDASNANNSVESPNEGASVKEDPRDEEGAECVLKHKHRDSTSTQASESTDSSPTTTISTADSSALTDPSPSSSPESPVTIVPLSSFSSRSFAVNTLDDLTMSENKAIITENYDRPMTSPTFRKPRNAKGLALKLGTQDSLLQASAPPSPMNFIRPAPVPKPRRKPSNLTLQTSSSNFNSGLPMSFEPPPTPSLRPNNIHHSLSMNSLNMFSPDARAGGPPGGMRLPSFERSQVSGLSNTFRKPPPILEMTPGGSQEWREEPSTIRTQLASRADNDIGGDAFDRPADEDAKSPGYPDGPIVIYDPFVFLYLEPTAEEASKFDVVMNVASEVKNPFEAKPKDEQRALSGMSTFDSMDIDKKEEEEDIPEPMTAASVQTFRTAFEHLPSDNQTPTATSPTTPKPPQKQPEYIHIPWEHNTDITKDLMGLCEIIDDRVSKGKKVLIHCQQGASRSASLIIAYGLYRNPSLTVDAAYKAAQARSKYVSPNISLMYSLQDFRKALQGRRERGQGRSPAKHRMALSVDEIDFHGKEGREPPQTAPLPQSAHPSRLEEKGGHGDGQLLHARGNSTPNLREMSPGSSSAPSALPWPAIDKKLEEGQKPTMGPRSSSTPTKPFFTNFDFSSNHQRNESTDTGNELFFTPTNNEFSSPMNVDTPPDSQPSSSTAGPSLQGFGAHREHTAKRKPAPFLNFKPMHPLRSAPPPPPPPAAAGGEIKERVVTLPPAGNLPDTPALFSPRLLVMAGPAASNNFGFHAPVNAQPSQLSMGFSSMGPPPPPVTAQRSDSLPKLELGVPSLDMGIMSPKTGNFEISPFDEVMGHDEQLETELAKALPNAKPEDILQTLKPKKSFIFDRTKEGLMEAMAKPLPPLPGQTGGGEKEGLRVVDPRSPPLRGESGIVRSIDDVLEH